MNRPRAAPGLRMGRAVTKPTRHRCKPSYFPNWPWCHWFSLAKSHALLLWLVVGLSNCVQGRIGLCRLFSPKMWHGLQDTGAALRLSWLAASLPNASSATSLNRKAPQRDSWTLTCITLLITLYSHLIVTDVPSHLYHWLLPIYITVHLMYWTPFLSAHNLSTLHLVHFHCCTSVYH